MLDDLAFYSAASLLLVLVLQTRLIQPYGLQHPAEQAHSDLSVGVFLTLQALSLLTRSLTPLRLTDSASCPDFLSPAGKKSLQLGVQSLKWITSLNREHLAFS